MPARPRSELLRADIQASVSRRMPIRVSSRTFVEFAQSGELVLRPTLFARILRLGRTWQLRPDDVAVVVKPAFFGRLGFVVIEMKHGSRLTLHMGDPDSFIRSLRERGFPVSR